MIAGLTEPRDHFLLVVGSERGGRHAGLDPPLEVRPALLADRRADGPHDRGLHSSSFRLIISAFCGTRWVVHGNLVTKTAQVELRSGRV